MATTLTLFCLAIDNQKDPIGNIFDVEIQLNDFVSKFGDAIKTKMANQLRHVDANQLIIWKLLKLQPTNVPSSTISAAIEYPSAQNNGVGNVELLYPTTRLSKHWDHSPDDDYLHLIVQVPLVERPEKRRKLDDNQEYKIKEVLEAAQYLYKTIWKTPFDQIVEPFHAPELEKSFNYLSTESLSNLGLSTLGYGERVLLIRKEYDIAFDMIEEASLKRREISSGGIIVSGHPGIGKTCFLFYLLLRSLCSGRPTALQVRSTYYLLFEDTGVKLYNHKSGSPPDGTWALVDSNEEVTIPCKTFLRSCQTGTTYVVQTTSPKVDRWKSWRKHRNADLYFMDYFSWDEIHALGTMLNLSVEDLKNHYEKWGPSARTLINVTRNSRYLVTHESLLQGIVSEFVKDFDGHTKDLDAMRVCHRLVTIRPKFLDPEKRGASIGEIPTEYLNNLVLDAIGGRTAEKQLEFFNLINNHASFRGSAGFMFEMFVFAWLSSQEHPNGEGLDCTPVDSDSPSLTIPVCGGWSPFTSNPEDLGDHETPFCLKPDAKTFPTIDVIICTNDHLITVQATISGTHSANPKGSIWFLMVFLRNFEIIAHGVTYLLQTKRKARRCCSIIGHANRLH
ncbi:hypothetical protein B0F90DRAFT_868504 [Multifurca ochricompacta]|uniref:Crinkler effector protein N-terminal domain-containing protein n=1 Tax=Multifurca ochricompacta TaxID=376703 RepID=A0AAD4M0H8_9AGAM|nr:hypothetical protein B0F90DRAFT_868504 [Multifurca ochricompacta]